MLIYAMVALMGGREPEDDAEEHIEGGAVVSHEGERGELTWSRLYYAMLTSVKVQFLPVR